MGRSCRGAYGDGLLLPAYGAGSVARRTRFQSLLSQGNLGRMTVQLPTSPLMLVRFLLFLPIWFAARGGCHSQLCIF
jgi:hypothetical protein